jgi:hypothetical protein
LRSLAALPRLLFCNPTGRARLALPGSVIYVKAAEAPIAQDGEKDTTDRADGHWDRGEPDHLLRRQLQREHSRTDDRPEDGSDTADT